MLQTMESKFGVTIRQIIDAGGASAKYDPLLRFLEDHPSLWCYYLYPPEGQSFIPPLGVANDPLVLVRVNHGRWQTRCPFCPSAQLASLTDPWFFCAECLNATVDGCALPVVWPTEREELEALLLKRPLVTTRNWEPHESVGDIRAENLAHGVS